MGRADRGDPVRWEAGVAPSCGDLGAMMRIVIFTEGKGKVIEGLQERMTRSALNSKTITAVGWRIDWGEERAGGEGG